MFLWINEVISHVSYHDSNISYFSTSFKAQIKVQFLYENVDGSLGPSLTMKRLDHKRRNVEIEMKLVKQNSKKLLKNYK